MTKQSGLGDNIYVAGYDLSGDVSAVDAIRGSHVPHENTGINKSAIERELLRRDGEISMSSWFNSASLAQHAAFKAMPTASVLVTYCRGTTRGNQAANVWAKQINYDLSVGDDGSLATAMQALSDGYGLEWGYQLTSGKETITSAGNSTGVDLGNAETAAVAITSSSEASPTVITSTAHGLVTGDSVLIAGHSGSTPVINGNWQATRVNDNTYTIPVEVTAAGTGGTGQKTSTNFGASAYLQVFAVPSNTITVHIETSPDNSTYADVTGLSFTAAAAQTVGERIASTSSTAIVQRYARIVTAGTFASAIICCVLTRYPVAPG